MNRRSEISGFTLVELVIAIALLGIISVTVSSRWFTVDAFHADSLRAQLVAQARLAQRTALANSGTEVALVISESSGDWRYQIFTDDGGGRALFREVSSDAAGVGIEVSAGTTVALGSGVAFDLTFDALGNVDQLTVGGSVRDATSGIGIALLDQEICISPLGYSHDGNCV